MMNNRIISELSKAGSALLLTVMIISNFAQRGEKQGRAEKGVDD